MDSSDVVAKEMRRSAQEGFAEVRNKFDSIYNVVVGRGPEIVVV